MRICRPGWPFVGAGLIAWLLFALGAYHWASPVLGFLSGLAVLVAAFCAYFFRDPTRVIPQGDQLILSPADGKIMEIIEGEDPSSTSPVWILRIFLSVFEPHLQRSPVRGRIKSVQYKPGKFLDARDPKAAFDNEQNRIEIQPANPALVSPIVVTQIAGLIARRIVCWVQEAQSVSSGDQIGLIRFGSQVDMVIPLTTRLRVKAGDHVTAGDTVIAEIRR
jgi:phosphatidylserine decarboxylase